MAEIWEIHSTFPGKDEAVFLARVLLEERLIACANIQEGMVSLYRWEGDIRQESEVLLVVKTAGAKRAAVIERIKQLHSYTLPCIIAYPTRDGFAPYLQWVEDESR